MLLMTSKEYVHLKQQEALKYKDAWEIETNNLKKDEKDNLMLMLKEQFPNYNKELVNGVLEPKN